MQASSSRVLGGFRVFPLRYGSSYLLFHTPVLGCLFGLNGQFHPRDLDPAKLLEIFDEARLLFNTDILPHKDRVACDRLKVSGPGYGIAAMRSGYQEPRKARVSRVLEDPGQGRIRQVFRRDLNLKGLRLM